MRSTVKAHGLGLGLPIARALARAMRGDLSLEDVEEGKAFRLELPLMDGPVKGMVLLVEDEADTREMLGRALERAGYGCLAARSAEEALVRAKTGPVIDVVVTDVVMGGSDRRGLTLMNELRDAGIRAPIVVITAYADVDKVKMALNQGAAYFAREALPRSHGAD